jgi:hypothetical protein
MDYDMWMEVNIGVAKVVVDPEGTIYVKKCVECEKLLTAEEASYGHDCE